MAYLFTSIRYLAVILVFLISTQRTTLTIGESALAEQNQKKQQNKQCYQKISPCLKKVMDNWSGQGISETLQSQLNCMKKYPKLCSHYKKVIESQLSSVR